MESCKGFKTRVGTAGLPNFLVPSVRFLQLEEDDFSFLRTSIIKAKLVGYETPVPF